VALIPAALIPFDTETTGVDWNNDRIVTAFVGRLDSATGVLTHKRSWLINPGIDIAEGAIAVHGISNEHAQLHGADAATSIAEIVAALQELSADGSPITAYNARFDLTLLDREARRYGIQPFTPGVVVDPLIIDKQVDKYRKGRRNLTATTAHYGIALEGAHDAEADATATGLLACTVMQKVPQELTLEELHSLQTAWARGQAEGLQEYFRRTDPEAIVEGEWPLVQVSA
jgi:DNA polymerase III epsilon subunit-like protein